MNDNLGRFLIAAGAVLLITGVFLSFFKDIPLGRLPGDIHIQKDNFSLYFPITTGIILSAVFSLIVYLLGKK